ncbi:hypothetical protein AMS68_005202 [Peltaster fructicola]|uniref:Uncharacterized protein n=1 Tax=Peltaster fructicola TaxID=286661 RepID=A0A6H0XYE9_9PEZI|nr:hypothetical protein AMS68_005202 [Peltaster fructicola]
MARAVLEDSEDEEDDLLGIRSSQKSLNVIAVAKSTGSSERLKRQIAQAEHDLVAKSAMQSVSRMMTSMRQTVSPSLNRRHSDSPAEPSTALDRVKRIKSARESPLISSGLLSRTGNTFTEQSQNSERFDFIPPGSIQDGFLTHEPYSMFGQSGDTVPDNTATQQLVREMAVEKQRSATGAAHISDGSPGDFNFPQSSSVLLSTSQVFRVSMEPDDSGAYEDVPQAIEMAQADIGATPLLEVTPLAALEVHPYNHDISEAVVVGPEAIDTESSTSIHVQQKSLPDHDVTEISKVKRPKKGKTSDSNVIAEEMADSQMAEPAVKEADLPNCTTFSLLGTDGSPGVQSELQESVAAVSNPEGTQDELSLATVTVEARSAETSNKPAAPKSKKKGSKKSKRSHMTIFEDHVDVTLDQQAPNPRQQQAGREAALLDTGNSTQRTRSRLSKSKIVDDDQDELALDHESSLAKSAEKSKKRPRIQAKIPEVQTSSSPDKSAESRDGQEEEKPLAETEASASSVAVKVSADVGQIVEAMGAPTLESTPLLASTTDEQMNPDDDIRSEQVRNKHTEPPHTPAKLMSGPIMRVGLSKRQRIPSLLKIVRPPKK